MADVGTVIHPTALGGQMLGRSILGIAHAIGHRWVYDQRYGVALAKRFYNNRPPTILDVPQQHGLGRRRPARSGNAGRRARHRRTAGRVRLLAVLNAISDAVGDEVFVRAPVLVDHIVKALDTKKPGQFPLTANV